MSGVFTKTFYQNIKDYFAWMLSQHKKYVNFLNRADKRQACVYYISTIALDKATSDKENQLIDVNLNMEGGEEGLINAESIVGLYCILA